MKAAFPACTGKQEENMVYFTCITVTKMDMTRMREKALVLPELMRFNDGTLVETAGRYPEKGGGR